MHWPISEPHPSYQISNSILACALLAAGPACRAGGSYQIAHEMCRAIFSKDRGDDREAREKANIELEISGPRTFRALWGHLPVFAPPATGLESR